MGSVQGIGQIIKQRESSAVLLTVQRSGSAYTSDTVRTIYVDGDLIDPDTWFIDGVNGTVIFATAPAANSIVTWSGEFHVPVRFDSDDMTINMLTHAKGNLGALGLRELRVREDIDADEYDNLRGFLTEFDKTDLDTMLDLLHVHVNTNWGA